MRYRTFGPRFWAGFIDSLIFIPVALLNLYLSSPERGSATLICWAAVFYSTYWIYSVSMHARYGQTVGKWAMKVRVMDLSERALPTVQQALLRDIGYIVPDVLAFFYFSYLVLTHTYFNRAQMHKDGFMDVIGWAGFAWFFLELVTMLLNDKRRAIHDLIAGTVVVRVK